MGLDMVWRIATEPLIGKFEATKCGSRYGVAQCEQF